MGANRLQQAREYIGLSTADAAKLLRMSSDRFEKLEASGRFSIAQWDRLSRLYRRPLRWLKGEPVPPVSVPADVAQMMDDRNLSDKDRQEVVGFVEFLSHRTRP